MKTHPRNKYTLDELFLHTFVYVDDWLKAHEERLDLPRQAAQVASYSELFTIALVGEMQAQPFESVWYRFVKDNLTCLFPRLPHYSRYHRTLRKAEKLFAELAISMVQEASIRILDSKPLPIAKGKRTKWARCLDAARGFSTMGMVYGFKLHSLVTEQGLFERWLYAPADVADITAGRELVLGLKSKYILGDKAYIGMGIITPKRKNMKDSESWTPLLNKLRKRVETSFSSLVRSFNLHAAQVKTFASLRTRINIKIAAFNLLHSGGLLD